MVLLCMLLYEYWIFDKIMLLVLSLHVRIGVCWKNVVYQIVRLADVLGEIGATKGYAGATISIFLGKPIAKCGEIVYN